MRFALMQGAHIPMSNRSLAPRRKCPEPTHNRGALDHPGPRLRRARKLHHATSSGNGAPVSPVRVLPDGRYRWAIAPLRGLRADLARRLAPCLFSSGTALTIGTILTFGDTLHHLGEVSARMQEQAGVFA